MYLHFSWECDWHLSQVDDELPSYFVHLDLLADGLMPPCLGISSALQPRRGLAVWECGVRKRGVAVPKKSNGVRKRGNQTPFWTMPLPKTFLWRPVSKEVGYFFDIDDMTWISLKITERLRFLKVMIFMESPLIIQFSFTDYSWAWILSNSVFPTAKLKLKLEYFKVNMFDEFMKLINFSFYCALFENNRPSKHQKATENKSHKIHRHATIELLSL